MNTTCASTGHLTCDSHVHVFDPARFAYTPQRRFTPGSATVARLRQHLAAVGAQRVVLVQPSVYGHQHHALVDALATLNTGGQDMARGVAVLAPHSTAAEVDTLAAAGVVGTRLNLAVHGHCDAHGAHSQLQAMERLTPLGWHIQLHAPLAVLAALAPSLAHTPRTYVVDHLGLPGPALPPTHPHWQALLSWLATGQVYVKLSAPYLASPPATGHTEREALVRSLVAAAPHRLLWGSNWPHTQGTGRPSDHNALQPEPFRVVDDPHWLAQCRAWAGEHAHAVLAGNAARLYRFHG
jgi:predicted TIM-barrel fold metal-dependent hydrolase